VRINRRQLAMCFIALGLATTCTLSMVPAAVAQDFPSKPVMLIIRWPPGGATDIAMRAIAEAAAKHLGQPIVIDNNPHYPAAEDRLWDAVVARISLSRAMYPVRSQKSQGDRWPADLERYDP
jgi:ABC-type sugar transport system substrate-binding protein